MDTPNHYELLCVAPDATADEIRNAYRRLIRMYHPDVVGNAGEAMTLRLNDAQRELLDPALRARYNRGFADASRTSASASAGTPSTGRQAAGARPTGFAGPRDYRRPPTRAARATTRHPAWAAASLVSITAIVALTVVVFAWSYSGQLSLTTPRVIPPLVIAVGWLVAGLQHTSKLFVGLLVIGAVLWPLTAFGGAPFVPLTETVPSAVLACLSVFALAVLALRVSAPLASRPSRLRTSPA